MHVSIVDIVEVESEATYHKFTTTVWMQEDANDLVPHRYVAWFIWFDGDLLWSLFDFGGPPGAANDDALEGTMGRP